MIGVGVRLVNLLVAILFVKDNHLANMAWWLKSAGALYFEL